MSISTKNLLLKKNFVYYNLNSNNSVLFKYSFLKKYSIFFLIVLTQVSTYLNLQGQTHFKKFYYSRKKKVFTNYNNLFRSKRLTNSIRNLAFFFLLKLKKKLYCNCFNKSNIFFIKSFWSVLFFSRKLLPVLFFFRGRFFSNNYFFLIKKIMVLKKYFFLKRRFLFKSFFFTRTKFKFFYLFFGLKFLVFFFLKRFKFFYLFFLSLRKFFNYISFLKNLAIFSFFFFYFSNFFFFKFSKFLFDFLRKFNFGFFVLKKNVFLKIKPKKFKFFVSFMRNYLFNFGTKDVRLRRFFYTRLLSKRKKLRGRFWEFFNFKCFSKNKPILHLLLNWDNFFFLNFKNVKKKFFKRRAKLTSIHLRSVNKNLVIFANILKYRKKPIRGFQKNQMGSFELLLWKINQLKSVSFIYKHLLNNLYSIRFLQNWYFFFKIPILVKINSLFTFARRGWLKLFKIFKKSFYLGRFTNAHFFPAALISVLVSIYFRNPIALLANLTENLEKQWRHRQHLFFSYFLIMAVLWKFELKKISSFQRVKSVYITIRGKINSGTRTKYFQIKSPYKPSMLTLQNHMNFSKMSANAKTGTFGIQSWLHY